VVLEVDEACLLEAGEDLLCGGGFGFWGGGMEELGEVYELVGMDVSDNVYWSWWE
jgi:hypothetical protein